MVSPKLLVLIAMTSGFQDPPTLEELARQIEGPRNEVASLSIHTRNELDYAAAKLTLADLDSYVIEQNEKHIFSGEKLFKESKGRMVGQGKITSFSTAGSWNGVSGRSVQGSSMSIHASESDFASGSIYFHHLCWAKGRRAREEAGTRSGTWLPSCFGNGTWSVAISGSHVVAKRDEPLTRFVFDPALGYALVHAEFPGPRNEAARVVFSRHQQVGKNRLHLPTRIEQVSTLNVGGRRQEVPSVIDVLSISVDPVADAVFELKPKRGWAVADMNRKMVYTYQPVGDDTLDAAAEEIAKLLPAGKDLPKTGTSIWWWVGGASAAVLACGLILHFRQ